MTTLGEGEGGHAEFTRWFICRSCCGRCCCSGGCCCWRPIVLIERGIASGGRGDDGYLAVEEGVEIPVEVVRGGVDDGGERGGGEGAVFGLGEGEGGAVGRLVEWGRHGWHKVIL